MKKSKTHIKSIGRIGLVNGLSVIFGLASTAATVRLFGVSREIECFFIAMGIRLMLEQFLQGGRAANVLIPAYHDSCEKHNQKIADQVFSVIINWSFLIAAFLSLIGYATSSFLIPLRAIGFNQNEINLSIQIFQLILPTCVCVYLSAIIRALANAKMQFGKPEIAGLVAQIAGLTTTLILFQPFGIWAMVAASWVNSCLQLAILYLFVYREGYRHRFDLTTSHFNVWKYYRYLATTTLYAASTQTYLFVLDSVLTTLPDGALALFKYTKNLYTKISSVVIVPVSRVYFSHFSKEIAAKGTRVKQLCEQASQVMLAIVVPIATLAMLASVDFVSLLWGSRSIGPEQYREADRLLFWLLLFLPLQGFFNIWRSLVIGHGHLYKLDFAFCGIQLLSALVAWHLANIFGLFGVAITLIVNLALQTSACLLILRFTTAKTSFGLNFTTLLKWTAIFIFFIVFNCVYKKSGFYEIPANSIASGLLRGAIISSTGAISIFITAWVLAIPEARQISTWVIQKINRQELSPNRN